MQQITGTEWRPTIKSDLPLLVDFFTPTCMPCRMLAPLLDKLEKEFQGQVLFLKVDAATEHALAEECKVSAVPAVLLFRGGAEVARITGLNPEVKYRQAIQELLG